MGGSAARVPSRRSAWLPVGVSLSATDLSTGQEKNRCEFKRNTSCGTSEYRPSPAAGCTPPSSRDAHVDAGREVSRRKTGRTNECGDRRSGALVTSTRTNFGETSAPTARSGSFACGKKSNPVARRRWPGPSPQCSRSKSINASATTSGRRGCGVEIWTVCTFVLRAWLDL